MTTKSVPFTLRSKAGLSTTPASFTDAALVIIDAQVEYSRAGALALSGLDAAVANIAALLTAARAADRAVIHVVHRGPPGGLFDPAAGGRVLPGLEPLPSESIVEKTLPNSFANTDLAATLDGLGRLPLVLAGFMTHMCVSSTARAALDLGHQTTVVSDATATRSLPSVDGGPAVEAQDLHRASLAGPRRPLQLCRCH